MIEPARSTQHTHPLDAAEQLLTEVETLIGEFGAEGFKAAVGRSTAAETFESEGGNATLRIAQVVARDIVFDENPKLAGTVVLFATGLLPPDSGNITRHASRHGMTKQALSKRIVSYADKNGLPPSTYMRSKKDRRTYALTNQPRSR